MKNRFLKNSRLISHQLIDLKLKEGMIAVDATVGNGNDTLLLAKKVGDCGKVYGFDIQDIAIKNTLKTLKDNNLNNRVKLIKDSHENILKYINEKLDLVIFNLGYLPKGDHSIITKAKSTLKAIESVLSYLNENGILIIVSYYGHLGGEEEKEELENYLEKLDQKKFTVLKMNFLNQINSPPILFCIEKII
ncbi:MAG: class I SAM-dependent methyltransferase [Senegalia sp. (in: firmicutes)]|uniref:tRNA (mnm(5)s(2)U34)-methyltransferase n=1 Tax=Senegalia sp. (in: firmicutes) TaxID=1924098 RepID=UPI003F98EB33